MFNASNSRFYSQIMESLAGFFGLKAEDTTEAELHQRLTEAETQTALAEKAKADGLAAAAEEVNTLKTQLATLTAEKAAAEETTTDLQAAITMLTERATALESDLTAANSALAAKVKEVNTLAGEVARLTAGKLPKGAEESDGDDGLSDETPDGKGQVIEMKWPADSPFATAN